MIDGGDRSTEYHITEVSLRGASIVIEGRWRHCERDRILGQERFTIRLDAALLAFIPGPGPSERLPRIVPPRIWSAECPECGGTITDLLKLMSYEDAVVTMREHWGENPGHHPSVRIKA